MEVNSLIPYIYAVLAINPVPAPYVKNRIIVRFFYSYHVRGHILTTNTGSIVPHLIVICSGQTEKDIFLLL